MRSDNLHGAAWMVAAMAFFAIEDACVKALTGIVPVAHVLVVFGLGGMVLFWLWSAKVGENLFTPAAFPSALRLRAVPEIAGRLFYVLALAYAPLSSVTVILQAAPLVVVGAAALLFGEQVGWRRWCAVLIGLAGVIVIVDPNGDAFTWSSLWAVLGMLGFAARDLASRAAGPNVSMPSLGFYGFAAILIAGVLYNFVDPVAVRIPDLDALPLVLGMIITGVAAYASLMLAMRTGDVSFVTPFRYTRLLFGVALGVAVFGETLSLHALIGSALVVLSGLFIVHRGRKITSA